MRYRFFIILFLSLVFITANALAQTSLTFCSYGGTWNEGLGKIMAEPFTKATGIKVILTTVPRHAKMTAQVKTGNIEWDIVEVQNRMYSRGWKEGLFEPLDLSMIKKDDFVDGAIVEGGIGLIYHAQMICYNTTKWAAGKGPKSMKDVWNVEKFPGLRTLKDTPMATFEAALLADDVPKEKLYPLDMDRALRKLDQLKPYIRVFWNMSGQFQQAMREREADIGVGPGGRVMQMTDKGVPLTWEWGDNIVQLDYLSILKGCKKKAAAMKFIAFMADAKRQAALGEWGNYGPANKKAYQYISKEKAVRMPTYPPNFEKSVMINGEWYTQYGAEANRKWQTWKMK